MNEERLERPPAGFERVRKRAANLIGNPEKLRALLRRASEKAREKRGLLEGVWSDLMALLRLLRAWVTGEYKGVTWQTMLLVTTAILYFVMPLDVIPDFLAGWGFLDDAAVIGYVVRAIRGELERFYEWEAARATPVSAEDVPEVPLIEDQGPDRSP